MDAFITLVIYSFAVLGVAFVGAVCGICVGIVANPTKRSALNVSLEPLPPAPWKKGN